MNRRKLRKLLDSVADQLTGETNDLIAVLQEIKAAHEQVINSGDPPPKLWFHYDIVKKVNKAIRLVNA